MAIPELLGLLFVVRRSSMQSELVFQHPIPPQEFHSENYKEPEGNRCLGGHEIPAVYIHLNGGTGGQQATVEESDGLDSGAVWNSFGIDARHLSNLILH